MAASKFALAQQATIENLVQRLVEHTLKLEVRRNPIRSLPPIQYETVQYCAAKAHIGNTDLPYMHRLSYVLLSRMTR